MAKQRETVSVFSTHYAFEEDIKACRDKVKKLGYSALVACRHATPEDVVAVVEASRGVVVVTGPRTGDLDGVRLAIKAAFSFEPPLAVYVCGSMPDASSESLAQRLQPIEDLTKANAQE